MASASKRHSVLAAQCDVCSSKTGQAHLASHTHLARGRSSAVAAALPRTSCSRWSTARTRTHASEGGAGPSSATDPSESADVPEIWGRLNLIKRQLNLAVAEESYELAARLRDESKNLLSALPPVQQYLFFQVEKLKSESMEEKWKAVAAMAEAGDESVLPDLCLLLADDDMMEVVQAAMWAIFMRCRDPVINDLMMQGTRMLQNSAEYDRALSLFDSIIKRCPSFAEAYNKRATVQYMAGKFAESIEDCKMVLSLQPLHFGAASGLGLCYTKLHKYEEALQAFKVALRIHPGMKDIAKVAAEIQIKLARDGRDGNAGPE